MDYYTSKFLNNKTSSKSSLKSFFNKILVCVLLFLIVMILIKNNPSFKNEIYAFIYENNISFSSFREWYSNKFGGVVPFDKITIDDSVSVFSEEIKYNEVISYNNGAKLNVDSGYLVPVIESGIVVYMGEKEDYGYTIIVEQVNGIDVSYSSINPIDIKIYDYVEKGTLLGETKSNKLYLIFQKNGEYLDYKKYI